MSNDIFNPRYWAERLEQAREREHLYQAVYLLSDEEQWAEIEANHRRVLAKYIKPTDSILDAGCGYGRLLGLLPPTWHGPYIGLDLSVDLVREAYATWYGRSFQVWDLRNPMEWLVTKQDWAVCIAVRDMVIDNKGLAVWEGTLHNIRKVAKRVLILEYKPDEEGEVIE